MYCLMIGCYFFDVSPIDWLLLLCCFACCCFAYRAVNFKLAIAVTFSNAAYIGEVFTA